MNSKQSLVITRFLFKFIIFISFVILTFVFFYQRIGLSYHGNFHLSIINQIERGINPPENVCLAGVPINYPWAYHLMLALLNLFLGISPILLHRLISLMSFLGFYIFAYKLSIAIFKNNISVLLSTILIVFGINLLAPIFFTIKYSPGNLLTITTPSELIKLMTPMGERYASTFIKFLNFTSYSPGIFFVSVIFYKFIRIILRNNISFKDSVVVSGVLLLVSFIHPFSALFCVAVLFPSFFITFFLVNRFKKELFYFVLMNISSFIVSLPYLISISDGVRTFSFNPDIHALIEYFISYPVHIVLLFYVCHKLFFRKGIYFPKLKSIETFLFFSSILVLIGIFLFDLVGGNDYKLVQLTTLSLSPFLVIITNKAFNKPLIKNFYILVSILVITKLVIISYAYYKSDWATNVLAEDIEIYNEIEKRSNKTAIIVNSDDKFQDLRGSFLANRENYAIDCSLHTEGYPYILNTRLKMISEISSDSIKYLQAEMNGKDLIIFTDKNLTGFDKLEGIIDGKNIYWVQ